MKCTNGTHRAAFVFCWDTRSGQGSNKAPPESFREENMWFQSFPTEVRLGRAPAYWRSVPTASAPAPAPASPAERCAEACPCSAAGAGAREPGPPAAPQPQQPAGPSASEPAGEEQAEETARRQDREKGGT